MKIPSWHGYINDARPMSTWHWGKWLGHNKLASPVEMQSHVGSKTRQMEAKSKPPPPPPKPPSLSQRQRASHSAALSTPAGKRGVGWPWDNPATHFLLYNPYISAGKLTWLFNWELWRPEGTPAHMEWVPCVRTAAQAKDIDPFLTDITNNQGVLVKHFLGFNEPEHHDQANMSVDEAVRLWREAILPAKAKFGFRLGSPGMTSDVGQCKPWLTEFLQKLGRDGGIDFLVVHWYGPSFPAMRQYLEDMYHTYHLPLWVNEFACSTMGQGPARVEEVEQFLQQALPWLDACDWVERYAYFGIGQGKDVGDWVGRASNFTETAGGCEETDSRRLSRIGRLYCES